MKLSRDSVVRNRLPILARREVGKPYNRKVNLPETSCAYRLCPVVSWVIRQIFCLFACLFFYSCAYHSATLGYLNTHQVTRPVPGTRVTAAKKIKFLIELSVSYSGQMIIQSWKKMNKVV